MRHRGSVRIGLNKTPLESPVEKGYKAIAKILFGLDDINVIGLEDNDGEPLHIHIECSNSLKQCPTCGCEVHHNGLSVVELKCQPVFGRSVIFLL